jgi:hypothetical protein
MARTWQGVPQVQRRGRGSAPCLRQLSGKPERASLGVSTDAPPLSGVDDLTAEIADPLKRRIHVRNRKVRERHLIARACPSWVEAKGRASAVGLPAFTFTFEAALELYVQDPIPEPPGPSGVIGGELHESDRRGHFTTIRLGRAHPRHAVDRAEAPTPRPYRVAPPLHGEAEASMDPDGPARHTDGRAPDSTGDIVASMVAEREPKGAPWTSRHFLGR